MSDLPATPSLSDTLTSGERAEPLEDPASTQPPGSTEGLLVASSRYELLRELARGGQSIVYVALDRELRREVAFKVPRADASGVVPRGVEARFLREARITARLDHPNIIAVHEIGRTADGRLFCAQRLVQGDGEGRGRTLAEAMRAATTLRERLALLPRLLEVSNAVAFAHGAGVIHRDLKPDNVVLGTLGQTIVLDWGLARVLTEPDDAVPSLPTDGLTTVDGQIFGTPLYMSPEQARGERARVGKASDTWSLGVMLYELLAGVPPVSGTTPMETVARVRDGSITPLSQRAPQVPKALAAVVTRALERDEARRYPDAGALGTDLRDFLAGRPVGVYDYSVPELARLFVRRNRAAALVGAVSLGVLLVAVAALALSVREARESLAQAFVEKGRLAEGGLRWEEAAVWYAAARERSAREDAAVGLRVVWPRARNGARAFIGHAGAVRALASSPDGATLFSGSTDRSIRVWDVAAGAPRRVLEGHTHTVNTLAVSADGGTLFSGSDDDTIRRWDVATGQSAVVRTMGDAVNALSLAPGGRVLAVGCEDHTVSLVDLASGEVRVLGTQGYPVYAVAFSPDGELVASGAWDGRIEVRAVSSGALITSLSGHTGSVLSLAFTPDGTVLASGGRDTSVRLWKTSGWGASEVLQGNAQKAYSVAWSGDGRLLVSAGADGTSRVWVGPNHLSFPGASMGRDDELMATTFLGPTALVATAGRRGVISVRPLEAATRILANEYELFSLSELDDGRLAMQHNVGFALIEPRTLAAQVFVPTTGPLDDGVHPRRAVVVNRAGTLAVGSGSDFTLRFFDVASNRSLGERPAHRENVEAVAFSPDEARVVTGGRDGQVLVWDVAARSLVASLPASKDGIFDVAFSPDGTMLASAGYDRKVRLFETGTWREVRVLEGHEHGVRAVRFSRDGKLVASAGWDRSIRLWHTADGSPAGVLYGHQDQVTTLDFHPDGRRLASGSHDGTVRLWSLDTLREIARVIPDEVRVNEVLFSRDGRRLYYARQSVHSLELLDASVPETLGEVLAAVQLKLDGLQLEWALPRP